MLIESIVVEVVDGNTGDKRKRVVVAKHVVGQNTQKNIDLEFAVLVV
jgi:hypothetical protein